MYFHRNIYSEHTNHLNSARISYNTRKHSHSQLINAAYIANGNNIIYVKQVVLRCYFEFVIYGRGRGRGRGCTFVVSLLLFFRFSFVFSLLFSVWFPCLLVLTHAAHFQITICYGVRARSKHETLSHFTAHFPSYLWNIAFSTKEF